MRRVTILLMLMVMHCAASAAQVACPRVAPQSWAIGPRQLESVRVMSYPAMEALGPDREYYATPPWEERERAGFIEQTWHINESRNFKYDVDCVYSGTKRFIQLNLADARTCVARWRARSDHGVVPRSLQFSCR